ncbi:MAG: methylenetetrahydrofolate reductase C-terminal domain-containing protein [Nitrospirae bacterium]|nr:methylenetetrahydrofolate reductase C-terminal domain-containing protein [Nitrospirota bacterium]
MIVTKRRDFNKLKENINRHKTVFLLGCSECAALCGTGGEPELKEMKGLLEAEGKEVTGLIAVKSGCQVLGTKLELKPFKEAINKADCIIVMSCGAGTQTAAELFEDKPVYPANNTMYLGNMTRFQVFDERCSLCGECILDMTGGICPITRCAKGLLNGPCGGSQAGKCEISPDMTCAWQLIIERLSKTGAFKRLEEIIPPKNWNQIPTRKPDKRGK